jgi:hypothetical protein
MQLSKWFGPRRLAAHRLATRGLVLGAVVPLLAGIALFEATTSNLAQADTMKPRRIHGTIDKVDDNSLELTERSGTKVTFKLVSTTGVVGITKASAADIKADSFIGTAALPQPDGTLKALEVHIFPASMKGTGEGERPWDQGKNSTMTNGLVGDVVGNDGRNFTVKFDGKERKVVVPANAPVVMIVPADRSLLTPGAKAIVFADPQDAQTAARITVGENGLTPPM